jgi:hypothetical protein
MGELRSSEGTIGSNGVFTRNAVCFVLLTSETDKGDFAHWIRNGRFSG